MDNTSLMMEQSKTIQLGVCEICHLSVTLWDEYFGILGARYSGVLVSHDACQSGKVAVSF